MNVTAGCSTFDLNQLVLVFWCPQQMLHPNVFRTKKKKENKYRIPTLGALYKNEVFDGALQNII